jgi:acyl-coenzyme A synthetase/AMP-(fatty) acid ligase
MFVVLFERTIFQRQLRMTYEQLYTHSLDNQEGFWREQAQQIHWFKFPKNGLTRDSDGLARWFKGGKLNTCYLAVDNHVENGRGDQVAFYYDSPATGGVKKSYTYRQLQTEVARLAGLLRGLGVGKGDRVIIYMPMIPEVAFAMLACARLGAVHSVVFGGFAAHELAIRIDDAQPKVLLMGSGGKEFDKIIAYKPIVDRALDEATYKVPKVVCYQRDFVTADLQQGRDLDWVESLENVQSVAECEPVDATDPLYILYTSGTTGKPKGVVRDNGGHAVAMRFSMKMVYGVEAGDVFWAASDMGWAVGHSYIVYAPLITGCTSIIYEGKPVRSPDAGVFWRVISEYGVKVFFTAPTAIRAIRKEDPNASLMKNYDLSCLKTQFLAGERCDVSTLEWLSEQLGKPVIDHWWQTESGSPMLSQLMGLGLREVKAGSCGTPVPSFDIQILDDNLNQLPPDTEGAVCIKYPLPPGCLPTLWQDTERFKDAYLAPYSGYYFTGDGGYKDADGYVFITGRIDDVINVSGHRLSTSAMEEIVAAHPSVAECAVVGVEDDLKGQMPVGFVVLKAGESISETQLENELVARVRDQIGAVAAFRRAVIVKRLPKTRSGKILRKIMRFIADKKPFNPPSTIEDMTVLDELAELMREKGIGKA